MGLDGVCNLASLRTCLLDWSSDLEGGSLIDERESGSGSGSGSGWGADGQTIHSEEISNAVQKRKHGLKWYIRGYALLVYMMPSSLERNKNPNSTSRMQIVDLSNCGRGKTDQHALVHLSLQRCKSTNIFKEYIELLVKVNFRMEVSRIGLRMFRIIFVKIFQFQECLVLVPINMTNIWQLSRCATRPHLFLK